MAYKSQLLKGILEGCILKIISFEKTYGYEIAIKLKEYGFVDLADGTLYPLLIRIEKKKLILGELLDSPYGPKRKYYTLTKEGQDELTEFENSWLEISESVNNIFNSKMGEEIE